MPSGRLILHFRLQGNGARPHADKSVCGRERAQDHFFVFWNSSARLGSVPDGEDRRLWPGTIRQIYFTLYNMAPIVAVNVFDPSTHKTAVDAETRTFNAAGTITLANKWVSGIVVKSSDEITTHTIGDDYTVAHGTDGTCTITRVTDGDIVAPVKLLRRGL